RPPGGEEIARRKSAERRAPTFERGHEPGEGLRAPDRRREGDARALSRSEAGRRQLGREIGVGEHAPGIMTPPRRPLLQPFAFSEGLMDGRLAMVRLGKLFACRY